MAEYWQCTLEYINRSQRMQVDNYPSMLGNNVVGFFLSPLVTSEDLK